MSIAGCYAMIRKYEKLKENIGQIISHLNNYTDSNNKIAHDIAVNYIVDGNSTPVQTRIKFLGEKTDKTSNYLKNSIIPAIDSEIRSLYRLIAQLEAEAAAAAEAARASAKAK